MSEEPEKNEQELDPEELERQSGEPLPDREAMSIIRDPSQWNMPPVVAPEE